MREETFSAKGQSLRKPEAGGRWEEGERAETPHSSDAPGRTKAEVSAGVSMMSSARDRPEAQCGLQEAAPPSARESRREAAATAAARPI